MSLCRNYPIPSNRMAVMWSIMPIKDAVVLEYGPAGTTHFGAGFYGSFGINLENSLFTTHISEDDIIMGDVTRLEKAIVEVDESYKPKVIFIVASAVIAVIGTDIKGVCKYMSDKVNAKLICFDDGGFGGDYTVGLENTYTLLTKEFTAEKNCLKDKTKYNILGASAASYRIRSDVWEIKNLIKDAFEMEVNAVLGLEATIEELKNMRNASINIVMRKEALPAAKYLKEKFDIPYIYQCPFGYKGTLEWLKEISNILAKDISHELVKYIEEKVKDTRSIQMAIRMSRIVPKSSIIGDYDTILGFNKFCEEFGFLVDKKICNHSLKGVNFESDNIINYKKEKEKLNALKELTKQLVFGDEVSIDMCCNSNTKVCVSFPYPNLSQVATHLPFMGIKGADYLMEVMNKYFAEM
ncbi:nitrogenase component 1 [Fusobacterium sp. PH5-44]|uniref:nitrogenase component 1 n=1 Tax=unclassified Fusobacterium TaxID=2648384 RepID=UPI003D1CF7D4